MDSIYFNKIEFYQDLILRSSTQASRLNTKNTTTLAEPSDTSICARIRPLSDSEKRKQEISGLVVESCSKATLFEPRRKANGKLDANKHEFSLDRAYNEDISTETIYENIAQEFVPWIWAGGIGTIFAYGQTGSGKSYTVGGITSLAVKDIMAMASSDAREVYVCCFEILGKKVYDLQNDRRVFSIMEDTFGTTHLVGIQEENPSTEAEFLSIIETSSLLRASAQTSKNDQSSRSHAVCRIRIVDKLHPEKPDGELFLVDLAGSEGSQDSKNHSAERLVETKDINTSLSILKDCIRGRSLWAQHQLEGAVKAKGKVYVPWRNSKLTQVLKHVFDTQGERACKALVIACVAPSIVDSAHSKNTLRYAEMLKTPVLKGKRKLDVNNPSAWTNEMAKKWVSENSGTPAIKADVLVENLTGIQLYKLPQVEFISRCLKTEGIDQEKAIAFYQKLWRYQIEYRSASRNAIATPSLSETASKPIENKTPFHQRLRPGMFVRLGPGVLKLDGVKIAMIMSPATAADFREDRRDERMMICAPVGPSIMPGAYELIVARTEAWKVGDMKEEVLMEYDFATRYYYMDL